ncbi:TMEM106C isoform 4, partial [Pan troglodytes]
DDGIKVVKVTFNKQDSLVILTIMATLKIRNSNFYTVAVTSLSSQIQYMNTVVNFTGKAEMGGPFSYVYFFCTVPEILVHNIVIFMRTCRREHSICSQGLSSGRTPTWCKQRRNWFT